MHLLKHCRIGAVIVATLAAFVVLVTTLGHLYVTRVKIPRLQRIAEESWIDIGRPMSEFESRLSEIPENDSLRELTRDLQPFGIHTLYKKREGEQDLNDFTVPKEVIDLIDPANLRDGDLKQVDRNISYLNQHASDLDHLYKGILGRSVAIWNLVPRDGLVLRVPSYFSVRKMSQIIWADALQKLERGDEKGATEAVAAGLKMTSNIGEQPVLLSQMIRVGINGLYAKLVTYLPDDPEALLNFPAEVDAQREMWRNAIQTETWAVKKVCDSPGLKPGDFKAAYEKSSLLEKARMSMGRSVLQGNSSLFMMSAADHICISKQVKCLAISDLGVEKMNDAGSRLGLDFTDSPSLTWMADMFRPNWSRSWVRLNATLLLREQAELIRAARAQMRLGKSGILGEPDCIVVPGAKWHIVGDTSTNSLSLRLTPIPIWTRDREVINENFFLLPLDGSRAWKFRSQSIATGVVASRAN